MRAALRPIMRQASNVGVLSPEALHTNKVERPGRFEALKLLFAFYMF